jgi:hypothetical protein
MSLFKMVGLSAFDALGDLLQRGVDLHSGSDDRGQGRELGLQVAHVGEELKVIANELRIVLALYARLPGNLLLGLFHIVRRPVLHRVVLAFGVEVVEAEGLASAHEED